MSKVDYLTEDSLLPAGQKFVCMSFLTDKENKTTLSGIKIRGVFATYDEACAHAKNLQNVDEYFNVFVGEMGSWLPFDPNPDSQAVKDSQYANDQLNNMMKAYLENQEKAKIYHEQRKNELVKKNILDNLTTRHDNLKELQKKHKKTKNETEKQSLEQSMKDIEEQINKMEEKKKDIDEQLEQLNNQVSSFGGTQPTLPKVPKEMDNTEN
jgi:molecular chaperone DnaK (HSP70)